jgi:hypothetical protein
MTEVKLKAIKLENGWTLQIPANYSLFKGIENQNHFAILSDIFDSALIITIDKDQIGFRNCNYDLNPVIQYDKKIISIYRNQTEADD